ncbi:MAG: hypothetical protein DRQ10_03120 [Candidatus Hydrothermota bacterium]|nr:MAG: hypothetical protein DRQ10_03120 [Candidatus Hydrothermae bacterium]
MFFTLLEEAVRRLSGKEIPQPPEVKLRGVTALLPESYIPEAEVRIAFYRRISNAGKLDELDAIRRELRDRFGRMPREAELLFRVAEFKIIAASKGYDKVVVSNEFVEFHRDDSVKKLRIDIPVETLSQIL